MKTIDLIGIIFVVGIIFIYSLAGTVWTNDAGVFE
jgi:hypothetical protein